MQVVPTIVEIERLESALASISLTLDHRDKLKDRMDLVTADERKKVREAASLASKLKRQMKFHIDPDESAPRA